MTSHSGAAQAQGFSTHVEAVCAEQQSQQYLYNAYEEAELVSFLLTPKPEMQEPIFFSALTQAANIRMFGLSSYNLRGMGILNSKQSCIQVLA